MRITSCVPPPLTWHIFQIIVDVLSLVVSVYVLNQFRGHWLLFDALNATIIMNLKFEEKIGISFNLHDLIDDDSIVAQELSLFLTFKENYVTFEMVFFHFKKYERNRTHNMLSLMLNPRFKSLRLVSSFIG